MTMPRRLAVPNADGAPVACRASMLALVTDAYGGYGGIAQYNRDFLGAAARSGQLGSILVLPRIAPNATGLVPAGLVQERPVKGRLRYALRALIRAWRTRPAIIFNAHVLHAPLSLILARLVGARLVSQLHGTEAWEPVPRRCRRALEASDLILTVSRDTRARALDQLRIAPERVVVLNNTVGVAFRPGDHATARTRLGLGDELVILTVARLDERDGYKGHDRIIKLIPDLRARGHSVTYLVAGVGPDEKRLARLAQDLGVSEYVRFLGMVKAEDLPDLYRAADLFALPSTGEGFGIAFIEAMACGTPAIGLAVGGAPDALADGSLGACVAPGEFPAALTAALQSCRTRVGQLPQLVLERFGQEQFSRALSMHLGLLMARSEDSLPSQRN